MISLTGENASLDNDKLAQMTISIHDICCLSSVEVFEYYFEM